MTNMNPDQAMNPEQAMMAGMMGLGPQPEGPPPTTGSANPLGQQKTVQNLGEDTIMGHLTPGEIVLPLELVNNTHIRSTIERIFGENNIPIEQFTVGHEMNIIWEVDQLPVYGWWSDITDDVLGFDPGGGGIYDVPVLGEVATVINPDPVVEKHQREATEQAEAAVNQQIAAYEERMNERLEDERARNEKERAEIRAEGLVAKQQLKESQAQIIRSEQNLGGEVEVMGEDAGRTDPMEGTTGFGESTRDYITRPDERVRRRPQ